MPNLRIILLKKKIFQTRNYSVEEIRSVELWQFGSENITMSIISLCVMNKSLQKSQPPRYFELAYYLMPSCSFFCKMMDPKDMHSCDAQCPLALKPWPMYMHTSAEPHLRYKRSTVRSPSKLLGMFYIWRWPWKEASPSELQAGLQTI